MTNKNETIHTMKKTGLNGQQFLLRHKIYGSAEPPVYQIFNERNRNPSETSEWDPRWLEIAFPRQFRHGKQQLSSAQPAIGPFVKRVAHQLSSPLREPIFPPTA